jgi:hypothetical protein
MDQGIQYEVIRKREEELKPFIPTIKISIDSVLSEDYVHTFKKMVAEEQMNLRT